MFFKKSALALAMLISASVLVSAPSSAQSTPIPRRAEQDQTAMTPLPFLPGSYNEIETDHVLGETNAPITMIVYASVTCPHCAHWFETVWPGMKKNYVETGKLRVVFREFPTQPAQLAFAGFLLANCAPEDQYFPMIEHQMAEQAKIMDAAKNGFAREAYLEIAQKAGMADEAAMNKCLSDQAGIDRIQNSLKLAQSANVKSVPNFIIGGELYKGMSDYLSLAGHLDNLNSIEYSPIPNR